MFSFLSNLFGNSKAQNELQSIESIFNFARNGSIEEKIEYIKTNCSQMASWLSNHSDMDVKKAEEIIILTVNNHVLKNYLIPFMKNHVNSSNVDAQLLQVERLKAKAADDIDWQLSFDAAERRR